ncbi:hypothetical protein ILUMI_09535 [Ignelater luminosus]|uniref:ABC transporter domain-containing protein n=1 Tax=Ignelater luminosus TaxID=2038154 RepID=A0A8K0GEY8_IGNLU|nr:hypothetical protein ILUMI_09535 [Ignelater luminosus]
MQEDLLQPYLTVEELMIIAAKLKLGDHISSKGKAATVTEVLKLLGLETCRETRTDRISGGQRKRLSIALELVSNPPVIFLDEPTSGLDSVSVKHCIDILKLLAGQGRTVICTIHQPSSYVFQSFNQVYFMQHGMCVYNGSTSNLIPFMSCLGYGCPVTYSPPDYIIETAQTVPESVSRLVDSIKNGKVNRRDSKVLLSSYYSSSRKSSAVYEETTRRREAKMDVDFPTSFWTQFSVLYLRMMLQTKRNTVVIWVQLFYHALCVVFYGGLFYGVGNNGSLTVQSLNYCFSVMIFFVYTYLMSPVLLFPFEVRLLKREYFNRWYGLKPYFLALSLRSLPLMLVLGMAFIIITYFITDQPMELDRFILFSLASILVGIASEGLGTAIGSVCNITNGSIVAPAIGAPIIMFCIYGMGYGQFIGPVMKIVTYTSYMRVALVAVGQSIFGNRHPLECTDEIFCYYQDPKRLLRDAGMANSSYTLHILGLIAYVILFRLIAYLAIRLRLTSEIPRIVSNYTKKFLWYT